MSFIIDVFITVLFFCFIVTGYRKGFLKSVLGLISTILASIISGYLAKPIASFIYEFFIYRGLRDKFSLIMSSTPVNDARLLLSKVINAIPKFIASGLDDYGITNDKIMAEINGTGQKAPDDLMNLLKPVFTGFIRPIIISILFIALVLLFGVAIRVINNAKRISIINKLDSCLGAGLGVIKFGITLLLFVTVIKFSQPFITDSHFIFSENIIDNTLILKKIYHNIYCDSLIK